MSGLGYVPTTEKVDEPCSKCGSHYRYISNGTCSSCLRKSFNKNTNMELVNKRRQLEKDREQKEIDNPYYFED